MEVVFADIGVNLLSLHFVVWNRHLLLVDLGKGIVLNRLFEAWQREMPSLQHRIFSGQQDALEEAFHAVAVGCMAEVGDDLGAVIRRNQRVFAGWTAAAASTSILDFMGAIEGTILQAKGYPQFSAAHLSYLP